jgi:hypothetical protein
MENRWKVVLLFVFFVQSGFAQSDSVQRKAHYFNRFLSGTLIGCGLCNDGKDFTLSFTTLQGIAFPSGLKLSVGTGIQTYYDWRMIPVTGGVTIDKEQRPNSLFFQVHAGHSFGRYLLFEANDFVKTSSRGGFTINPMVGYRIGNEKVRLYMQAGYQFQRASTYIDYRGGWWGPSSSSRSVELSRVVVQVGFGFN